MSLKDDVPAPTPERTVPSTSHQPGPPQALEQARRQIRAEHCWMKVWVIDGPEKANDCLYHVPNELPCKPQEGLLEVVIGLG